MIEQRSGAREAACDADHVFARQVTGVDGFDHRRRQAGRLTHRRRKHGHLVERVRVRPDLVSDTNRHGELVSVLRVAEGQPRRVIRDVRCLSKDRPPPRCRRHVAVREGQRQDFRVGRPAAACSQVELAQQGGAVQRPSREVAARRLTTGLEGNRVVVVPPEAVGGLESQLVERPADEGRRAARVGGNDHQVISRHRRRRGIAVR